MPSFCFLSAVGRPHAYSKAKGVFLSPSSPKALLNHASNAWFSGIQTAAAAERSAAAVRRFLCVLWDGTSAVAPGVPGFFLVGVFVPIVLPEVIKRIIFIPDAVSVVSLRFSAPRFGRSDRRIMINKII